MKLVEKLLNIQNELKAPKGQFNAFGKYKYRSNEDILEAVKPLLAKYKTALVVSDEIVEVGGRLYVKATSTLHDIDSAETLYNTAYAREEEDKKGMDGSQITGASSSYARKYSLNGLFAIDDNKDSDSTNLHDKTNYTEEIKEAKPKTTVKESSFLKVAKDLIAEKDYQNLFNYYKVNSWEEFTETQLKDIIKKKGGAV